MYSLQHAEDDIFIVGRGAVGKTRIDCWHVTCHRHSTERPRETEKHHEPSEIVTLYWDWLSL